MTWRPFEPAVARRFESLAAWQAEAASLVATMAERWRLTLGTPYVGGVAGSVLDVVTHDGGHAVLKVGYPHDESIWEAVGLEAIGAGLAPTVLDQDVWTWALLLARADPGTTLLASGIPSDDAVRAGGELLAALHRREAPHGLPTLRSAMEGYAVSAWDRLPGQRVALADLGALEIVRDAVTLLQALARDEAPTALLHGDFNPGNIVREGDRWLVIDPKPLIGDPAFDLWPLVSQLGSPWASTHPAAVLASQLATAAESAGVDAGRSALWAFARSGLNVSWYLSDGDPAAAATAVTEAREWAKVAGV